MCSTIFGPFKEVSKLEPCLDYKNVFWEFFNNENAEPFIKYLSSENYSIEFICSEIKKYSEEKIPKRWERFTFLIIILYMSDLKDNNLLSAVWEVLPLRYQIQMMASDNDIYDLYLTKLPLSYEVYYILTIEKFINDKHFDIISPFLKRLNIFKKIIYKIRFFYPFDFKLYNTYRLG